mmetsp:Transcript_18329/g.42904  ORF Transcript_18329/g.42904 Transcript_18329/m.42904 type:complete len:238 (-) Transcript_18329:696-1409(-)
MCNVGFICFPDQAEDLTHPQIKDDALQILHTSWGGHHMQIRHLGHGGVCRHSQKNQAETGCGDKQTTGVQNVSSHPGPDERNRADPFGVEGPLSNLAIGEVKLTFLNHLLHQRSQRISTSFSLQLSYPGPRNQLGALRHGLRDRFAHVIVTRTPFRLVLERQVLRSGPSCQMHQSGQCCNTLIDDARYDSDRNLSVLGGRSERYSFLVHGVEQQMQECFDRDGRNNFGNNCSSGFLR